MRPSRQTNPGSGRWSAFTLIELIFVMLILAVVAAFVAPNMNSFFRSRVLSSEARRLLAVIHHGQTRAVAEGVPVVLWLDPGERTYGLSVQAGYVEQDSNASRYDLDPSLTLVIPPPESMPESELGEETMGVGEGLATIRFLPTGFYEEGSTARIVLQQGEEGALELVPTANHLSYEILPVTNPSN